MAHPNPPKNNAGSLGYQILTLTTWGLKKLASGCDEFLKVHLQKITLTIWGCKKKPLVW